MSQLSTLLCLVRMRHKAGASPMSALTWAAGLLWRTKGHG